MDTKQKIFFILFLFSSNFFSLTNIDLTEISKANDEEKVTKTKIFKDSLVLIDEENKFNFLGFKQKGIYKFIEDKNNLNSDNLFFKNFEKKVSFFFLSALGVVAGDSCLSFFFNKFAKGFFINFKLIWV